MIIRCWICKRVLVAEPRPLPAPPETQLTTRAFCAACSVVYVVVIEKAQ